MSVADHFDANLDPTFYFYADKDPTYLTLGQIFSWLMLSLDERASAGLLRHFYDFLKKYWYIPYVLYGTR